MSDDTVAFVGGGNMTRAIVRGLLEAGVDAGTISISEPAADQRDRLTEELAGVRVDPDNAQAVATARVVVLAVKPQVLPVVCRSLADTIQASRPLIISIAAGVRSADIEQWLGGNLAVIRVMPNQPALLGLGASGIYANSRADADDMVRAERVMRAVGVVVPVTSEAEMDAVTAISGSGPAYFYLLIDMLVTSGIDMGLDATTARALAVETARGAAALAPSRW